MIVRSFIFKKINQLRWPISVSYLNYYYHYYYTVVITIVIIFIWIYLNFSLSVISSKFKHILNWVNPFIYQYTNKIKILI